MAQIEGDLGQAVASLTAARKIETLQRTRLLPQYDAAYRAMLAGYGQGRGDLSGVLEAEHRLHDTNLDILRSQIDQQIMLAAIERLIGGEL
jgi:outer membrane protein TolC